VVGNAHPKYSAFGIIKVHSKGGLSDPPYKIFHIKCVLHLLTKCCIGIPESDPYRDLRTECQKYLSVHITLIHKNLHSSKGSAWAYLYSNL
jgi:hypothetical protein